MTLDDEELGAVGERGFRPRWNLRNGIDAGLRQRGAIERRFRGLGGSGRGKESEGRAADRKSVSTHQLDPPLAPVTILLSSAFEASFAFPGGTMLNTTRPPVRY